jgi:Fe-S cluster assembly ATP-binding protein
VAGGIKKLSGPNLGVLIITHYQRILHYIKPDFVHVMSNGKIIKSGTSKLAEEIEKKGYDFLVKKGK